LRILSEKKVANISDWDCVEAFLSSNNCGVIFVRGSAKEFEVMR